MRNIILFLFCVCFCSCVYEQEPNKYISSTPEQICNSIVEHVNKKMPLYAQDYMVDEIHIDSLVLINNYKEPYNGYFVARFKKNNIEKVIYIKVFDIKDEKTQVVWSEEWDIEKIKNLLEPIYYNPEQEDKHKEWYE